MIRAMLILTFAAAGIAAGTSRPSVPPPARVPAAAPATRPAWTSVVFADPGDARRIVFVCDACGTMKHKMASLRRELAMAVDALGPDHSFNILFLQDGKPFALDDRRLVTATGQNKQRVAGR